MDIFDGLRRVDPVEDEDETEEGQYRGVQRTQYRPPVPGFPQAREVAGAIQYGLRSGFYIIGHGPRSGLWIHVEGPSDLRDYIRSEILHSLQGELPLGNVTRLRMSVVPEQLSCFPAMISRMASLTTLTVRLSCLLRDAALQDVCSALTPFFPGINPALIPAPKLETLSIEMLGPCMLPTLLVSMAERRVASAVPLVSVTCSLPRPLEEELLCLAEYVIEDVHIVHDSLQWDPSEVLTPVWMVTNDYWVMHPCLIDGQGLPVGAAGMPMTYLDSVWWCMYGLFCR